jgi:hypothetical protein
LLWHGFTKRAGKGSHTVYQYGGYRLTVPHQVPFLKAIYVKLALEILDALEIDEDDEQPTES